MQQLQRMRQGSKTMRIIKQKGDPSGESRHFWETVFTEDTKEFLDYYYSNKVPDANFYFLTDREEVVSMLHLNPYQIRWHGKKCTAYYIVAVATKEAYRHRGCMRALLQEAVRDAEAGQCPFLFLMPADPAIYEPFGFSYVYAHALYEPADKEIAQAIRTAVLQGSTQAVRTAVLQDNAQVNEWYLRRYTEEDAEELAAYAERELASRYPVYCLHDPTYLNRLTKELKSENGDLILIRDKSGRLSGYVCYTCEEEEAYQEVILTGDAGQLFSLKERKPMIMAKMTCGEDISELKGACYFPEIV